MKNVNYNTFILILLYCLYVLKIPYRYSLMLLEVVDFCASLQPRIRSSICNNKLEISTSEVDSEGRVNIRLGLWLIAGLADESSFSYVAVGSGRSVCKTVYFGGRSDRGHTHQRSHYLRANKNTRIFQRSPLLHITLNMHTQTHIVHRKKVNWGLWHC